MNSSHPSQACVSIYFKQALMVLDNKPKVSDAFQSDALPQESQNAETILNNDHNHVLMSCQG